MLVWASDVSKQLRLKKTLVMFCLVGLFGLKVQWNLNFTKVAGDRPNLFVKWRVRYIENLDITNLSGSDQNVCYIEVIVND